MTIPDELAAKIRRLYYAEHWKVGTIATELAIHHDAVERVLQLREKTIRARAHDNQLVAFHDFIRVTLEEHPRLRATRLFDMIEGRGYMGSPRSVRRFVQEARPIHKKEAFLSLTHLPGEQAQVDWGHVGSIVVPGGKRALWAFVMVLAYSRAIWAELVLDLTVFSLLRSLVRAYEFFGGAARTALFDNPKTVVIERHGSAIRFHPLLLSLCGDLHVSPRLCAVRKPQQKGGVERAIRYLKERFFAARRISNLTKGNEELLEFLSTKAMGRTHPTLPERTVADVFAEEKKSLLALPNPLPSTLQVLPVHVDKTAFITFDSNRYSVPPEAVTLGSLSLAADDRRIRLLEKHSVVAEHERNWGKHQRVESPEHRTALLRIKRGASAGKGRERLLGEVPALDVLFTRWVNEGRNLGNLVARAISLLDLYGPSNLEKATQDILSRGIFDVGSLALACERARTRAGEPMPIPLSFAEHVDDRDVLPHDLGGYDV